MRVVIQRVKNASVTVEAENYKVSINKGMLVLCAFENEDSDADLDRIVRKLSALRIFDDESGVMNLSIRDIDGEMLVVSQFTLFASTAKGNRPSYIRAAKPDISIPLYERFCGQMQEALSKPVAKGIFGADMAVSLVNDGPVTIIMDSKQTDF